MPQNRTTRFGNRNAFSLSELLVALGLVIVLLILAGPAFSRGKASAQAAHCLVNLRKLGICHRLWRQERNDQLWDHSVRDIRPSRMLYEAGLIKSARSMQCPAATRKEEGAWIDYSGSDGTSYGREFGKVRISYGTNRYAVSISYLYGSGGRSTENLRAYRNRESRVPVFMDATFWNMDSVRVWNDFTSRSRIALRHQGRAHVVFLDGHVEQLDHEGVLALSPVGVVKSQY
ncbi:MAG TPA: H-X9-DG-CTERM domain-containing protein [Chthoniobacteraceae bacterium]|nr:H-X9-DG-CTERM domain-containing protein [Chthoniobacteraceae bacterium]